jgi:ADP-ribosylglycohydrolase
VLAAQDFKAAVEAACRSAGKEAPLYGALVGALYGIIHGHARLPAAQLERLAGAQQIDAILQRLAARGVAPRVGA